MCIESDIKIEVRTHNLYGVPSQGVFANGSIKAGEVIWREHEQIPEIYTNVDIDAETDKAKKDGIVMRSYMVGDGKYASMAVGIPDIRLCFNHSCDPNCWFESGDVIVASRDIQPDEHIVYDYSLSETEGSLHSQMKCMCGAQACRGELKFSEWRTIPWRKKNKGHISAFVQRKMQETCFYHPGVVLKYLPDGSKGLYVISDIRRGEVVLVFTGKVVSLEELLHSGLRAMELSLQVNDGLWQIPIPSGPVTADFINHHCDATLGMQDSTTAVARRDLKNGDELSIDYGTVNSGVISAVSDNFQCQCGAAVCRGTVSSSDWKLPALQKQYWPLFPPFVKRLMPKVVGF